jgi:diguanylate cyclase (GGDEF)-like protein
MATKRALAVAAAALETSSREADRRGADLEPKASASAALVALWQRALGTDSDAGLNDHAQEVGRTVLAAGLGAGAVVAAGAAALRDALEALKSGKNASAIESASLIAERILGTTAVALDGWNAALLDPSTAPHWFNAQTRELQEHVRALEEMTLVDALTKLFNRRHFDRALETEIARAQRYELDMCLVMVDVDFFKRINDTYGHIVGDEVLCHVAEVLQAQARKSDVVARFGGEEFALILPETSHSDAGAVAERMRRTLESRPVAFGDDVMVHVTASLGYTSLQAQDTPRSVLERADTALYRAKDTGRNRVVA